MQNDIALLKLAQPITLSQNIQIACLPLKASITYPPVSAVAIAVGWGQTSGNSSMSQTLQNVEMTIFNGQKSCSKYDQTNWRTQICSGVLSNTKGICFGTQFNFQ